MAFSIFFAAAASVASIRTIVGGEKNMATRSHGIKIEAFRNRPQSCPNELKKIDLTTIQ